MSMLKPKATEVFPASESTDSSSKTVQLKLPSLTRIPSELLPKYQTFAIQEKVPNPLAPPAPPKKEPDKIEIPGSVAPKVDRPPAKMDAPQKKYTFPLDKIYELYPESLAPIRSYREQVQNLMRERNINIFRAVCDERFLGDSNIFMRSFPPPGKRTLKLEQELAAAEANFRSVAKQDTSGRFAEVNAAIDPYLQRIELTGMPLSHPEHLKNLRAALIKLDPRMAEATFGKQKINNKDVEAITLERLRELRDFLYVSQFLVERTELRFEICARSGYLGKMGSDKLVMDEDTPPEWRHTVQSIIERAKASPESFATAVKKRDEMMDRDTRINGRRVFFASIDPSPALVKAKPMMDAYDAFDTLRTQLSTLELKYFEYMDLTVKYKDKLHYAKHLWHVVGSDNPNYVPGVVMVHELLMPEWQKHYDALIAGLKAAKVPEDKMKFTLDWVEASLHYTITGYDFPMRYNREP